MSPTGNIPHPSLKHRRLTMAEWIPVSTRLPKEGQSILGCDGKGGVWLESFDPEEPLGNMVEWVPAPKLPEDNNG